MYNCYFCPTILNLDRNISDYNVYSCSKCSSEYTYELNNFNDDINSYEEFLTEVIFKYLNFRYIYFPISGKTILQYYKKINLISYHTGLNWETISYFPNHFLLNKKYDYLIKKINIFKII